MKILVIDKFCQRRDLAQMDMYNAISKHHKVCLSSNPFKDVRAGNYDLLYLGIYHQSLDLDLSYILRHNKRPIIIDQADNEEFIERDKLYHSLDVKYILSRYLPNEPFEIYCTQVGMSCALLPWFVNPDRFAPKTKDIDVAFMCSMYGVRTEIANDIKSYCKIAGKVGVVGEYWGAEYADYMSRSKAVYVECGRKCLTQKYIEATLSGCLLIGDAPLYPDNTLIVFPDLNDRPDDERAETIRLNLEFILDTYANEQWFINQFNELLK